ncbi:tetratricopeptide repeat protein [Geobacter sp.]|uniref:tetratricopeptide repeat protein n=1 Tax=Geobacter sp. TaxID=46610 RepID=UPI002619B585|nr:tetratricopeptide repeat protein [Geobacter sp.]
MKRENILYAVVALLVGLLGGFLIFSISGHKSQPSVNAGIPAGGGTPVDYRQRIAEAEKIVAREPGNLQAWVQLGNDYFDTDQPQKAINAYGKALELDHNNPNILTDQGIMYKRVGQFDRAVANFEKAQQIDPKHVQSLYNLGVVYMDDLKQPDKAIKAWNRYLELEPTSPNAQQIRGLIEQAKGLQQMKGGASTPLFRK